MLRQLSFTLQMLGDSQFIGAQVHNGEASVMGTLPAIGVSIGICAIRTSGGDGTAVNEGGRQHGFVANDGGPGGEALELDEEMVARLRVQVGEASLGALAVEGLTLGVARSGLTTGLTLARGGLDRRGLGLSFGRWS